MRVSERHPLKMYVSLLVSFWFFRGSGSRFGREIDGMDGSCRTLGHTFAAELAFIEIYISQIVLDGNGSERADLLALAAADAGSGAGLAGHGLMQDTYTRRFLGPLLRSSMIPLGQALTQAPQAVHFSSSTSGIRVSGLTFMAPNGQARSQSPPPRQPKRQPVSPA